MADTKFNPNTQLKIKLQRILTLDVKKHTEEQGFSASAQCPHQRHQNNERNVTAGKRH